MQEKVPTRKFSSPEEEIAYLRARVAEREGEISGGMESATGNREAISRETIAREELGKYSKFTPQSVLEKKYQLSGRELASTIERASAPSAAGAEDIVGRARRNARNPKRAFGLGET